MKHTKYFLAALLLVSMSGCLFVEKIETRVRFPKKNGAPGEAKQAQVTILYHNISSDAEDEKKLQEDFDELIKGEKAAGAEEETEDGIIIKQRHVFLENGKINARAEGVPEDDRLEGVVANGERILVIEGVEESTLEETNGKVLRTEKNYIIVWPASLEEIYWIQRFHAEPKDQAAIERNRPLLVRKLENHLIQK